jgi:hypothetical protein
MLSPLMGHVSSQFHVVFHNEFTTVNNIHLPGQMTKPRHWKELAKVSNNSYINEKHGIKHLWPTFDPKELFVNYYDNKTTHPPPAEDPSEFQKSVAIAELIATVSPSEGAASEASEGAHPVPPKVLQSIHTRLLQ